MRDQSYLDQSCCGKPNAPPCQDVDEREKTRMSAACLLRSARVAQEFTLAHLSDLYKTGLS